MKKNLPIIISVSLAVLVFIVGLFWIVYYKKDGLFQPEKEYNSLLKQKEEMGKIRQQILIPKPTPELIQKQKEELDKIRQQIMP